MFALSQHGSARASQALRTYAERRRTAGRRAREGDLLDRPERREGERGVSCGRSTAGSRRRTCARRCSSPSRRPVATRTCGGCSASRRTARSRSSSASRPCSGPGQSDASDGRPDGVVRLDDRSRDARAADLRLLPARRARGGGQAARDREARARRRAPRRRRCSGSARATIPAPPRRCRTSSSSHEPEDHDACRLAAGRAAARARCGRGPDAWRSAPRRSATARCGSASRRGPGVCGNGGHNITIVGPRRGRRVGERLHARSGASVAPGDAAGGWPMRTRTSAAGGVRREGQTTDLGTLPARQAAADLLDAGRAAAGGRRGAGHRRHAGGQCGRLAGAAPDGPPRPTLPLETRRQAVFWLGQAAGEAATRGLDSLAYDGGGELEVRKQAVFALSQRPADEGVPALIRIARSNPHAELRKSALFWLGQSEDPRAIALFERSCASQVILSAAKDRSAHASDARLTRTTMTRSPQLLAGTRRLPITFPPCRPPPRPPRGGASASRVRREAPAAAGRDPRPAARYGLDDALGGHAPAPGSAATVGRSWRRPMSRSPSPTSASTP